MVICERLKKIRLDNDLTQEEFANIISVSRSSIALYERGSRLPDISILEIICYKFNLPLDSLKEEYKNQKDVKKRNIKSFILFSLTSLLMVFSIIIGNFVAIYEKYGYNIYNDELKVKNSTDICIVKVNDIKSYKRNSKIYEIEIDSFLKYKKEIKSKLKMSTKYLYKSTIDYYIVFYNEFIERQHISNYYSGIFYISHPQFIEELPDYNKDLPYDKQEGKSGKIINYYIDLINKNK